MSKRLRSDIVHPLQLENSSTLAGLVSHTLIRKVHESHQSGQESIYTSPYTLVSITEIHFCSFRNFLSNQSPEGSKLNDYTAAFGLRGVRGFSYRLHGGDEFVAAQSARSKRPYNSIESANAISSYRHIGPVASQRALVRVCSGWGQRTGQ